MRYSDAVSRFFHCASESLTGKLRASARDPHAAITGSAAPAASQVTNLRRLGARGREAAAVFIMISFMMYIRTDRLNGC